MAILEMFAGVSVAYLPRTVPSLSTLLTDGVVHGEEQLLTEPFSIVTNGHQHPMSHRAFLGVRCPVPYRRPGEGARHLPKTAERRLGLTAGVGLSLYSILYLMNQEYGRAIIILMVHLLQ